MKRRIEKLTYLIQFVKQRQKRLIILSLTFIVCLVSGAQTSVVKIGIVTDTHFDRATYPSRITVAQNIVNTFNSENVDVVLGLGDMYDGNFKNLKDYMHDRDIYEVPWLSSVAPVHWALGNHDNWGITDDQYISNCSFIHSINYTVDLRSNWRIIIYSNVDDTYFSAKSTTLTWLQNVIAQAKLDDKKIIIVAHVRIDQDYPGNPPSFTSNPYSSFSYNANLQRDIINTAKANGADIKYVFQGHDHKNAIATLNGINYYSFTSAENNGSAAIIDIQDDNTLKITELGSQIMYKNKIMEEQEKMH
jgi:predicted phosphodiesterase